MNIIIVGAGDVGYNLAEYLSKEGHNITIIEISKQRCENIDQNLNVMVINDNGSHPQVLERANIRNCDMIITVTTNDDTNLLICYFAMYYGVPQRIARIKTIKLNDPNLPINFNSIGVTHVIEPENEVVKSVIKYIELPGVTEAENIHKNSVLLRGYKITENMPIAGKTLIETNEITKSFRILVALIIRKGEAILPKGNERILPGDEIIVMMGEEALPIFRELINLKEEKNKKIIVYGDTLEAIEISRQLTKYAERVIMVDPDESHAQTAASVLSDVEVLLGDCTDVELLQEIRVKDVPFFIAASSDTEDNIMSCLLAKAEGAIRTLAISNHTRHHKLFLSLGIDYVINPNIITTRSIMGSIIKIPIASLLILKSVDVQVTRFVIGKNSKVIELPLKKLGNLLKRSVIIGSILRGEELIIPTGDTIFNEGDEVLVLSHPSDTKEVGKIFKSENNR